MTRLARRLAPLAALFAVAAPPAFAQAQLVWDAAVSSAMTDNPVHAVAFGPDGESAVVGELRLASASNRSAWLYVRAADGVTLGSNVWPAGPVGAYGWGCVAYGPNGVIAVGGRNPTGAVLALCSSSSAFLWGPQALTPAAATVQTICFDSAGNIWAAGPSSSSQIVVAQYSPSGSLLGSTTWAHPANGGVETIAIAIDGQSNVLILGLADHAGSKRVYVLKLDPALGVLWERERFTLQSSQPGPDFAIDPAGNVIVACGAESLTGFSEVFSLWKLAPDGTTSWLAQTSDATHPFGRATDVALDGAGNLLVAGSWSGNDTEALVQSYDQSGNLRWSHPAGIPSSWYESVAVDSGGDVLVVGWRGSPRHALSTRYAGDGHLRWTHVEPVWEGQGESTIGIGVGHDGGAVIACAATQFAAPRFLRWYRLDAAAFPVCAGDGSVGGCPCANESPTYERSGCLHSLGSGGRLECDGFASLSADTLTLIGTTMPDSTARYFQGTVPTSAVFGDGLRCAGGTTTRIANRQNVGGGSQYPVAGDPSLSVAGGVSTPQTVRYQVYFRNAAPYCTPATFNVTNAVRVAWIP